MVETYLIYSFGLLFCFLFSWIGMQKKYLVSNSIGTINSYKGKRESIWLILPILLIILISGLRHSSVGIDSESYRELFYSFSGEKESISYELIEPGFAFMLHLYRVLNLHYSYIFFTASMLTWGTFYKIFKNNSLALPFVILVLFLDGYFFWTMNGMRQAISISIFTFSIKYITERNFKKYIVTIFLASIFHYSAILLLPFYLINKIRCINIGDKGYVFLLIYVATLVLGLQSHLQNITLWVFELIPKYSYYTEKVFEYNAETSTGLGVIFKHVLNLLLIYYSTTLKRKFPTFSTLINILLIGLIIQNVTYGVQILSRFSMYFSLIRVISIGLLLSYWFFNKNKLYHLFYLITLIIFLGQFMLAISQSANGCSPYQVSFSNKEEFFYEK